MRRATAAAEAIDVVVNTHANGDHCWGNQLVRDAEIVAHGAAPRRWPSCRRRCSPASWPTRRPRARRRPAAAHVRPVRLRRHRARAADHHLRRRADPHGRRHRGAAHRGRAGPHPRRRHRPPPGAPGVVFTGDILFHGGHPIVWAGPVDNWVAACDAILGMQPEVVVPGHGPVCGPEAVADERDYFGFLSARSRPGPRPACRRSTRPATSTSGPTPTSASPSASSSTSSRSTATSATTSPTTPCRPSGRWPPTAGRDVGAESVRRPPGHPAVIDVLPPA